MPRPRSRALELQSAYDAAVADGNHAEAATLQPLLEDARVDLAVAEATVTALQQAAETVDRERAARHKADQLARQDGDAQAVIEASLAAERAGAERIQEQLAQMFADITSAQDHFRAAQGFEAGILQARQAAAAARAYLAGDQQAARVSRPNAASVLLDNDAAIRALMAWRR